MEWHEASGVRWLEARRQLHAAGVTEVGSADLCTCCDPELFFSHRRDGDPRRQAGLVWLGSPEMDRP